MERVMKMASQLIIGIQNPKTNRFKGALIVKHPRRYPIEKITIDGMKIIETYEIGLNCISIYIVDLKR